ncbi:MAG TPA: hypothetical protein ENI63_02205 [Candidatus Kaiserbacteria bacterium]|nr:hypothetical protein [Candidatus Kaiserbacteria bacterium]
MDYRQMYDISFVPSKGSKKKNPHIVFSMSERHLGVFQTKLDFIIKRFKGIDEEYFGICVEFTQIHKDIFGNYTFGYDRCGYIDISEEEVYFHFELRDDINVNRISLTIWFMLLVLNNMLVDEEIKQSNRRQFIEINTICKRGMHGHSMSGTISLDLGKWLKKQGENIPDEGTFSRAYLPEVEEVMCHVWNKIRLGKIKKNKKDFRAIISPDGRFSLVCPGNACDVSIYYDQLYGDVLGTRSVRFACHNLDTAIQQVTLLAGLAKLCELARNDET